MPWDCDELPEAAPTKVAPPKETEEVRCLRIAEQRLGDAGGFYAPLSLRIGVVADIIRDERAKVRKELLLELLEETERRSERIKKSAIELLAMVSDGDTSYQREALLMEGRHSALAADAFILRDRLKRA